MTILLTIVILGVLIFVHELGHFLAAKAVVVAVEVFSIGFPPRMFGKRIGETEYRFGWIPLGGYVRMRGENPETADRSDPCSFVAKCPLEKIFIVVAGPLMNILLAVLVFWFVFFTFGENEVDYSSTVVSAVLEGSPAEKAGIVPGDRILKIEGNQLSDWNDMAGYIHKRIEENLTVVWQHGDSIITDTIRTMRRIVDTPEGRDTVGILGVSPNMKKIHFTFLGAVSESFRVTGEITVAMFGFIKNAFSGRLSLDEVGGPVMIAELTGQTRRLGIGALLFFIALISVNLGLINLFPFPPLDGAQVIFAAIEGFVHRPVSAHFRLILQQIGMMLLIALILIVTFNDIMRLGR